jgi:hypothetical protein
MKNFTIFQIVTLILIIGYSIAIKFNYENYYLLSTTILVLLNISYIIFLLKFRENSNVLLYNWCIPFSILLLTSFHSLFHKILILIVILTQVVFALVWDKVKK